MFLNAFTGIPVANPLSVFLQVSAEWDLERTRQHRHEAEAYEAFGNLLDRAAVNKSSHLRSLLAGVRGDRSARVTQYVLF